MTPSCWKACYPSEGDVPDPLRRHQGRTTPTATVTASSTAPTTRTSTTSRTSWSSAATWPATRRSRAAAATPASRRPAVDPVAHLRQPVQPVPAGPLLADLRAAPGHRCGLRTVHAELQAVRPQLARRSMFVRGPAACGPSVVLGRRGGALERHVELRAARERLQHDAVALGQLEQRGELLVVGVGVELEAQADVAEADRRRLLDAERAAEVEVALGVDACPR